MEVIGAAPETSKGLISALGWLPREKLKGHVVEWLRSDNSQHQEIGLGACALHREDCGSHLERAIADGDAIAYVPGLCAVLARSGGEILPVYC
jgi:hypothetical protein